MRRAMVWVAVVLLLVALYAVQSGRNGFDPPENFPKLDATEIGAEPAPTGGLETATFGSGCFWCTEAVFQRVEGVKSVVSGYTGGHVPNPSYEQICGGRTGHAEVIQVTYDPKVVSYARLLEVFWRSHDPTTLNQQGNDSGPQYRSAVFHHTERQRDLAIRYKRKIDEAGVFASPVVTEIVPAPEFYPAEGYHQGYYDTNPRDGYCRVVIGPKLDKLRKVFADGKPAE